MVESGNIEPAADGGDHPVPEPEGWADPLTGLTGPRYWAHILRHEAARMRRYQRSDTVALVEFSGFEMAPAWRGREAAALSFARLARAVTKTVRMSDHVARIGRTRFGILLIETDEVRVINFVHRLRDACRTELGTGTQLGVRIGWATPAPADGFDAAIAAAEERLADELFQSL